MNSSAPPQPPKECVYTQPHNPAHTTRTPAEETLSIHPPHEPHEPHQHHQRQYGEPQSPRTPPSPTIHRTAFSRPSSDTQLERLERIHDEHRAHETTEREGDIDLEYGVELQPAECDIAAAVTRKEKLWRSRTESSEVLPKEDRDVPPSNGKPVLKVYDDLERKKVAHEALLMDWMESGEPGDQGAESTVCERERARRKRMKQDRELDVRESVTGGSGRGVIAGP
ncbi:hypothetical protein FQN54_009236 [Arachnomyces sp. PD_36]|nr:hypothetical protein FQN54_009236 [Arachnomyces sp. PD_36]